MKNLTEVVAALVALSLSADVLDQAAQIFDNFEGDVVFVNGDGHFFLTENLALLSVKGNKNKVAAIPKSLVAARKKVKEVKLEAERLAADKAAEGADQSQSGEESQASGSADQAAEGSGASTDEQPEPDNSSASTDQKPESSNTETTAQGQGDQPENTGSETKAEPETKLAAVKGNPESPAERGEVVIKEVPTKKGRAPKKTATAKKGA